MLEHSWRSVKVSNAKSWQIQHGKLAEKRATGLSWPWAVFRKA